MLTVEEIRELKEKSFKEAVGDRIKEVSELISAAASKYSDYVEIPIGVYEVDREVASKFEEQGFGIEFDGVHYLIIDWRPAPTIKIIKYIETINGIVEIKALPADNPNRVCERCSYHDCNEGCRATRLTNFIKGYNSFGDYCGKVLREKYYPAPGTLEKNLGKEVLEN